MSRPRTVTIAWKMGALVVLLVAVCLAGVMFGSTQVGLSTIIDALLGRPIDPTDAVILMELRVPRTITATLSGAALGVAGLQMQTLFRNPLADPFVLGISSGATFGVACVILLGVGILPWLQQGAGFVGSPATTAAAALGAAAVMAVVLGIGRLISNSNTLLLLGVMMGSFVSAGVTVMLATAHPELVAEFIRWGFGSYHGVTWRGISTLVIVIVTALVLSFLVSPWMNALNLGDRYAATMGVNLSVMRASLIGLTSVLAGVTTAFCGPIQFLGIAIPHLARAWLRTADHRILVPATLLVGATLALLIDVLSVTIGDGQLPLNAANAAIGAPIVIYILVRGTIRTETA